MCDENAEWMELDDSNLPDFLVDIYTLDRDQFCNQPNIESCRDSELKCIDSRNIIPITILECRKKNIPLITLDLIGLGNRKISTEELMCSDCRNPAVFIRKIRDGWLCPMCSISKMKSLGISPRPNCCNLPSGCDSCGGIVNRMVKIHARKNEDRSFLLLCLRDECLMPFGYYLPREYDLTCTCDTDLLSDLKTEGLLIKDLLGTVGNFFKHVRINRNNRKATVLADLHMTRNDRCLPCQMTRRYQLITDKSPDWEAVKGKDVTCSCFSFPISSFSISRQGNSSLSTPVSSSNRRRSQSSGDLTEEYTDSTSEI